MASQEVPGNPGTRKSLQLVHAICTLDDGLLNQLLRNSGNRGL